MMQPDTPWRLHVLDLIEPLKEADNDVRRLCEGELFYKNTLAIFGVMAGTT